MTKHWGTLLLLAVLAAIAATQLLLAADLLFAADDHTIAPRQKEPRRRLSTSALNVHDLGGNATAAATVLTIHLTDALHPVRAHSVFNTDLLRRYGTGRISHRVVEHKGGDRGCPKEPPPDSPGPCLAVTKGWTKYHYTSLACHFPRCTTMVTNDEFCRAYAGFDARLYATAARPDAGYLPLGPRRDAWTSLGKIQAEPGFAPKAASARQYAFNAIFSLSTNKGRTKLAAIIEDHAHDVAALPALPVFTAMSKSWSTSVNDPHTTHLATDRYMAVVLNSVFTLAPAGHNPECFRMFEAAEAGSIPVFLRADLYATRAKCHEGLERWYDAPVLVLDAWKDLYPAIVALIEDPAALDARQEEMRRWYKGYMREVVAQFEDLVLAPPRARVPLATAKKSWKMRKAGQHKEKGVARRKRKKRKKNIALTTNGVK